MLLKLCKKKSLKFDSGQQAREQGRSKLRFRGQVISLGN